MSLTASPPDRSTLARFVLACERLIFGHRALVLAVLALITAVAAVFASRLHMSAGFGKQLPLGHEYTKTFVKYKDVLFGANRLIVVVHAKQGDIWKPETLKKLNEVTQALLYLPGVDRRSVSSLWTPNTRVMQVTEEGYEARDVIGGDNRDAVAIAEKFAVGLDVLTVVNETSPDSCYDRVKMSFIDDLAWELSNTEGVIGTATLPALVKIGAAGFNEGNPKWGDMPRDKRSMASFIGLVGEGSGLYDPRCTVLPINVYLTDHKAETIKRAVAVVKDFRQENSLDGLTVRLASGNAGVQAATNEVLEATELPMMLYVYATIVVLVFLTYRDWRAVIACCLPLTLATFIGYWFMKVQGIGLTVATLPVMVLAVGIGVDYAFYIYNRLQLYLADGMDIVSAFRRALSETGIATVFTAITLSIGVATWVFSPLKFQADMGLLLAFMFMLNMSMAITVLPALAVTLDTLVPRRKPVHRPFMAH